MTEVQWQWYAEMISQDRKADFDMALSLVEHLASFWNHEAVQKVREARKSAEQHAFMDDETFEKHVVTGAFKEDPLIKALQKIRGGNTNLVDSNEFNHERLTARKIRGPTDLSGIVDMTKN